MTGADAVMIGRAAQGRPWIFREDAHYLGHGTLLGLAFGGRGQAFACCIICKTTTAFMASTRACAVRANTLLGTRMACRTHWPFEKAMNVD
jgi:tRNA-dihydrouridine synthase